MNHRVIGVRWFDASLTKGPISREEIETEYIEFSVGTFVKEDKDFLVLAHDTCENDGRYRQVSVIPKVNVISVHEARVEKMRKRRVSKRIFK